MSYEDPYGNHHPILDALQEWRDDVEWDVCKLMEEIVPGYQTPTDVEPSYVSNIYPGPESED